MTGDEAISALISEGAGEPGARRAIARAAVHGCALASTPDGIAAIDYRGTYSVTVLQERES